MKLYHFVKNRNLNKILEKVFNQTKYQMTNVVRLNKESAVFSLQVNKAASDLIAGGIIALPTDTIYGLAALAQNSEAVNYIYNVKKRDFSKPMSICVCEIEDIYKWGKVTVPYTLLCSLLPGPVTLVFERTENLNPSLNPGANLVGIRIPDDEFILRVTELCKSPLALTSANISEGVSPLDISEFSLLWNDITSVYDGGRLGNSAVCRLGSTIVDLSVEGTYKVIRKGSALAQTEAVLHKYKLKLIK